MVARGARLACRSPRYRCALRVGALEGADSVVDKKNFFVLMRSCRAELGLTSIRAAEEIGLPHTSFRHIENGFIPRVDKALKIAEYYGFKLEGLRFTKPKHAPLRVTKKIGLGLKNPTKPELASFAKSIRDRRLSLQISQAEFAKRIGVDRVSLGRYEAGLRYPEPKILDKILAHLRLERSVTPKGKLKPIEKKPEQQDGYWDLVRGFEEYAVNL